MSDSHPETLTDPEHSDQAGMASSPPQSGDEVRLAEVTIESYFWRSWLYEDRDSYLVAGLNV